MLVGKKNKKLLLLTVSLGIFIFLNAVFLFANNHPVLAQNADQTAWGGKQAEVQNTIKLTAADPRIVVARIIQVFLGFLGIIAVVLIIYAGFLWMTSGGDDSKIQKAKDILKSAVIGLIIILSAFAIASFIINRLLGGSGFGLGFGGGGPTNMPYGNGAMGNCAIVDYYPVADQKDVARNTVVMVTFREEIKLNSIFSKLSDTELNDASDNIMLFSKCNAGCKDNGDGCDAGCFVKATAVSTDGRNLVIMPNDYLGSASVNTNYFVYLNNNIKASSTDKGIFDSCTPQYASWTFEVGTKLDLDPPYVKLKTKSGMLPAPDKTRDATAVTTAVKASGNISVGGGASTLKLAKDASVISTLNNPPNGVWSSATSTVNKNCDADLVVGVSSSLVPSLRKGTDPMGAGVVSSDKKTINFSYCNLEIKLLSGDISQCDGIAPHSAGCNWTVDVDPYQEPDQLTIGGSVYVFAKSGSGSSKIIISGTVDAGNVAAAIRAKNDFPNIDVTGAGNNVIVKAKTAGLAGNQITMSSNRDIFTFQQMSGGQDFGVNSTQIDAKDEPRNTIIKINFNDQMLPMAVSGNAFDLKDKIFVECVSGNCADNNYFFDCNSNKRCVRGKFMISNQYQTVEFQSNNKCGVNGCGEDIYCLPGGANLRVGMKAASLDGCGADNCVRKSPYTSCVGGHCQKADGVNYPLSSATFDGLMDKARNSLDGNRNANAVGPLTFYNENNPVVTTGDNFEWSFFVSDEIDINPPKINDTSPDLNKSGASTSSPITIDFSKIMMSYSLLPGYRAVVDSKNETVKHKTLNLWAKSGYPIGYWVTSDDEPGFTKSYLNHSYFMDYNSYRSQAGSGVKDVYQNCFKPSDGPGNNAPTCSVDPVDNPSCCNGTKSSILNNDGNCTN